MQDSNNISLQQKERLIQLPKIIDERGNLSFIEEENHIPFKIARSYWIYDVPGGEIRGSHAFYQQEEFIVALSGSFDVVLDDGKEVRRYSLNRSYMGIYIPNMTWRTLENFSTNSVCLVLSSRPYEMEDYIWDYEYFKQLALSGKKEYIKKEEITTKFPLNEVNSFSTNIYQCEVFEFPKYHTREGSLTAINNFQEIPFNIKRVFYTYDIPSGSDRGAHAHKKLYQYLIATSGSFDVFLDDGHNRKIVHLDRPNYALLIPPGIWGKQINFSSGAICMVLATEKYVESDYIRNYKDFLDYKSWK